MPTTLPFAILCTALALASHPAAQGTEDSSDEAKIQRLFSAWDRTGSPGCAVAIVRDGRTVYARGFGMANLEHGAPITTTTVFDAGSMAKQFTAMCVALLVEQKKLSFDDDIHVYIPELPRYGQPIAVRDLIHHTSGLREQHDLLRWAGWRWEDPVSEADILDLVTKQRSLNFTPGEEFLYSNTNYLLLAVIVKRVAGVSLKEFATERVFKPLAMTSTRFADDHDAILPGRATGHIANGAGFSIFNPAFDFVGPTSLYTTVEDLARWDANFYEPRVGTPETIALVRTPGRLAGGQPLDYAFGLEIGAYRGLRVESHSGADPGFRAELYRFPDQRLSVIVLANLYDLNPTALAHQVADIVLKPEIERAALAKPAPEPKTAPSVQADVLASYAGLYWSDRIESSHELAVEGETLRLLTSEGPFSLAHVGAGTFQLTEAPRRFIFTFVEPEKAEGAQRLRVEVGGQKPIEYVRVDAWRPAADALSAFTGEFSSEEGLSPFQVAVDGGRLRILRRKFKPDELSPIVRDVFRTEIGVVRFLRGADGRVIALEWTTERTRRMRFKRTG